MGPGCKKFENMNEGNMQGHLNFFKKKLKILKFYF